MRSASAWSSGRGNRTRKLSRDRPRGGLMCQTAVSKGSRIAGPTLNCLR